MYKLFYNLFFYNYRLRRIFFAQTYLHFLGIEISHKRFSQVEDAQILQNWKEYAKSHKLLDEDGMKYVSAATCKEGSNDRCERIKEIKRTNFRPWMCNFYVYNFCFNFLNQ